MDNELLYYTAICLYIKTRKKKTKWCKKKLLKRRPYSHANLFNDISVEPSDWRNNLRMNEDAYLQLLDLITPLIQKKDTFMRQCITPSQRLAATLRFLATGMNFTELEGPTLISSQRLGVIIPETCKAILMCLKDYMKIPKNQKEWKHIAQDFEDRWNFPHCLGAVGGKHIRISPPPGSGSYFLNYKQFSSLIVIACVNSNCEFIWCEVGTDGRKSDADAIKNSSFYEKVINGGLNIPPAETVGESIIELPYVFVGDEAFPLRPDFMRPYAKTSLNAEKRVFNQRLSRAQRVLENVFRILADRFRILQTCINLTLPKVEVIILACCVLHNYLLRNSPEYVTEEEMNEPNFDTTLTPLSTHGRQKVTNNAKLVQKMFSDFFNGERLEFL